MRKLAALILVLALLLSTTIIYADTAANGGTEDVCIAFTHDMHSNVENFPRVATILKELAKDHDTFYKLDAGDFSMGTLVQAIYREEASELRLLGYMDFDATTLGNHEFDYRLNGLTKMLNTALASGDKLPYLMFTAVDFDRSLADPETADGTQALKYAADKYGREYDYDPYGYIILEKNDFKMAIFGAFGAQSVDYTPDAGLYFRELVETAKTTVAKIKENEDVDMIVCLSHAGTGMPGGSEDEILAKEVGDIDVIVSGHSHTILHEPIVIGDTYVVSCGADADYVGMVRMNKGADGRFNLVEYKLIDTEDYTEDAKTIEKVNEYKELVNAEFLAKYGYEYDGILCYNPYMLRFANYAPINEELPLGNLMTDGYVNAVKTVEGDAYEKVDLAVVPSGIVRANLLKGVVTTADAFHVLSIGSGADGSPGYPLISLYLTGKELKVVAEIDASVSKMMGEAVLYMSGLQYKYIPDRLIMDKVTEVNVETDEKDVYEPVDEKKLYRVVTDLYSAKMLASVTKLSYGLLALEPKDKDGNPVTDYEKYIIQDTVNGGELKSWYAFASYLETFPKKAQGVPNITKYYSDTAGRKIEEQADGIFDYIKSPSKVGKIVIGAACFVVLLIVLIIVLIARRIARKKQPKVTYVNNLKF